MSAYKTATIRIGESEYKRLRDAEEQLRLVEMQAQDRFSASETSSIFEKIMDRHASREVEIDQLLSSVDHEIAIVEENAAFWLQSELEKLKFQANHQLQIAETDADAAIQQIYQEFAQLIQTQQQQIQAYQDSQISQLSNENEKAQKKRNACLKTIELISQQFLFIQSKYEMDSSSANELEIQRQQINQAIDYFNQGFEEYAFAIASQSHLNLTHIRMKMETQDAIGLLHLHELQEQAFVLGQKIESIAEVHAMDQEGNELDEWINLDYWSNGEHSKLVAQFKKNLIQIQSLSRVDHEDYLTYKQELDHLRDRSIELVTEARLAVLSSQLRFNVAQIVVQALETQGFYLEEADYHNQDFRNSFIAMTKNSSGNEVIVTIDPTMDLDEGGKLAISSGDAGQITEYELIQRNREIFQAIEDQGLVVQDLASADKPPIPLKNSSSLYPQQKENRNQIIAEKLNYGRR